jgi:hypothetical protein
MLTQHPVRDTMGDQLHRAAIYSHNEFAGEVGITMIIKGLVDTGDGFKI